MYEAVILAGGFGTRLKSVTGDIPKPMIDVNGEPFLYRLLKILEASEFSKVILSLCYKAEYVIERLSTDQPVSIDVECIVEDMPLGTGGAMKFAANKIKGERFLALNADTFLDIDYKKFFKYSMQADLLISATYVDDASRYGTLILDKENNVLEMKEKGFAGEGLINSGTYVIKKNDLMDFALNSFSFENEFIPKFKGKFKAFITHGYFIDIGVPEDYVRACRELS